MAAEEMTNEQLAAIRARLAEPPPLLALAERGRGTTALHEYLTALIEDRISLIDEVDRLRGETATGGRNFSSNPGYL